MKIDHSANILSSRTPAIHQACVITALAFMACMPSISHAQDDAVSESAPVKRERIVVKISHIPVKTIEEALLRVSKNTDLLVFGATETNKLVVDAPTDAIPNALGLIRELDRAQQMVNIKLTEVLISEDADTKLETMPTKQLKNRLNELAKSGDGKVISQLQLSGMSNTSTTASIGAKQPQATGTSTGRGGVPVKSFNYESVGTVFTCTSRIADDAVLVDFEFEKSDVVDAEDDDWPSSTVTTKMVSIVRIPTGESVVIGGTRQGPEGRPVRWQLVLSAEPAPVE